MRVKIRFTHVFDLIRQIILWPLILACGIGPAALLAVLSDNGFIQFLSILVFIIGEVLGAVYLTQLSEPIGTQLYLRCCCGVKLNYKEAKSITFLLDGSINGKWYPLKFLKKISKEERKQVLFEFAQKIKRDFYGSFSKGQGNNNSYEKANKTYEQQNSLNNDSSQEKTSYSNKQMEYYCSILGISFSFTEDELKKAYRKQIMKYHPDLYENTKQELKDFANSKTIELNKAYEYLCKILEERN